MLDDRPVLRERILASATFAGIAFGTLFALDFIVTGGFDFGAQRSASTYADPYGVASDAIIAQPPGASTVTPLALIDPTIIDTPPPTTEDLGDATAADQASDDSAAPSEDQLQREIAELYERQDQRAASAADPYAGAEDAPAADEDAPVPYDDRDLRHDPTAPDTE